MQIMPQSVLSSCYGIEVYLALTGNRLFCRNNAAKMINRLINWVTFAVSYYLLIVCLYNNDYKNMNLLSFNFLMFHASIVAIMHLLAYNSKNIASLYEESLSLVTKEDRSKARRISFACLAFLMITSIVWSVNHIIRLRSFDLASFSNSILFNRLQLGSKVALPVTIFVYYVNAFHYPFVMYQQILLTICLYMHLLYTIFRGNMNFSKTAKLAISNAMKGKEMNFFAFHCFRMDLNKLKRRFESVMNLFPFIWFTIMFFACAGYMWVARNISKMQTTLHGLIFEISVYFTMVFSNVITVAILSILREKSCEEVTQLADSLIRIRSPDSDAALLIDELQNRCYVPLTGWSMFELDRKFIVSYLSGLLTFAILFIQLTES